MTARTLSVTPYGMTTCCVCDEPTTHASPDDDGTIYPYCAECVRDLRKEFPSTRVFLFTPRKDVTP